MPRTDLIEASRTAWQQAANAAYSEQLAANTLTELEDISAHLDRTAHPDRYEAVRAEIDRRLERLAQSPPPVQDEVGPGLLWRRLWAALLDLFVMALILAAVYAAASLMIWVGGSFGEQAAAPAPRGPRGGGGSPFVSFLGGLVSGDAAAWANLDQWARLGAGVGAFLGFRALYLIPFWVRTGRSPGMRELGLAVVCVDGSRITWGRAALRFFGQYVLFPLTLGLSALWALRDIERRTLHDRLTGTRVIRLRQPWEKPPETALLE